MKVELKAQPYPTDSTQQYTLDRLGNNILILGLNSAWHLDHHYTTRVSINDQALTNALQEISRTPDYANCPIKIAVWHHPINSSGEDRIKAEPNNPEAKRRAITHKDLWRWLYITSLDDQAQALAERIRAHRHIENRLHWTKDVVLKEDSTPVCDGHAIINFAILRAIAVNLFRANGFASITQGIRMLAHDVRQLFSFLQ